jgi:hypothetical protein
MRLPGRAANIEACMPFCQVKRLVTDNAPPPPPPPPPDSVCTLKVAGDPRHLLVPQMLLARCEDVVLVLDADRQYLRGGMITFSGNDTVTAFSADQTSWGLLRLTLIYRRFRTATDSLKQGLVMLSLAISSTVKT